MGPQSFAYKPVVIEVIAANYDLRAPFEHVLRMIHCPSRPERLRGAFSIKPPGRNHP